VGQVDPTTGRFLRVNPKLCAITGYSEEELLGMTFTEITHPDDRQENFEGFQQAVHGGAPEYEVEKRYVRKDGQFVWVSVNTTIVRDEAGRPLRTVAVFQNITGRRQAEEARARLAAIVESSDDAIIGKTLEGVITSWNHGAQRMYGYSAEEVVGRPISILVPPERSDDVPSILESIRRGERVEHYETVRASKDGRRLHVSVAVSPIKDPEGLVVGASVVARDITERKRAQKEIQTQARQQEAVAELGLRTLAKEDSQAVMDEAVTLVARVLNAEYCEVLELLPGRDELLLVAGVGWEEGLVGSATVGAGFDSQAGYTLLSSEPVIVEDLRTESRFGGPPLLHGHGVVSGMSVIIYGREEPFGVLGVHTAEQRTFSRDDVNFLQAVANVLAAAVGRSRAEEALIEVREAERSRIARDMHDETLQDIVYALREIDAHRLLSEGGERGAALEEAANALRRSIAGLRGAIFDLSLAGGDEDGGFVERLESLVRLSRRSSPDREIELSVEGSFPRSLGKRMQVELQRIVQEALANVRRHSGAGRVSVAVGASGGKLWAEVEDEGRGFGPQTPAGMGTRGMHQRARALGGSLKIESEPGKGTKVRFEMTLSADGEETESEEVIRVLLIEDHASFREALASVFEREPGLEVVGQVGSLAEARKMLEDGAVEADVAIVDLGLPDGYGGDLIKELRAVNPRAQALVLSATLDRAEVARAVESGAAGVLHKSAEMGEVMGAVRRVRAGETLLSLGEVVELLRFAQSQREQEQEALEAIAQLTAREKEVLQALAEGLDSKEISERLGISTTTERNHVASLLAKLGVHSRLQALVFAARYGVAEIR
jgi:PAS domain S-box-containing protein